MTIEEFIKVGEVWSKVPNYKQKKKKAIDCVVAVLKNSTAPYVALSGGKDSVAMCYIVEEAARICGKDYRLWTHVSDASFPGTIETCLNVAENLGRRIDVDECPTSAFAALNNRERQAFGKTGVFFDAVRRYAQDKDVVFVGVRARESARRRRAAKINGQVFKSKSMGDVTVCHPLLWFNLDDVAAVLAEYKAPIHPIYYKTPIDTGVNSQGEEQFIRLSYLTSKDLLNKGTAVFIKYNYPELFSKLCEAWSDIRRYV